MKKRWWRSGRGGGGREGDRHGKGHNITRTHKTLQPITTAYLQPINPNLKIKHNNLNNHPPHLKTNSPRKVRD